MNWIEIITTPEITALLITVIAALLVKSRLITERDIKRAKQLIDLGHSITQAAAQTRVTAEQLRARMGGKE